MNHGVVFNTTNVPFVSYTKGVGVDTITAMIVRQTIGCSDTTTSSRHLVSDASESITGTNTESILQVYPNPAYNEVNVTSVNKITEITITNVVGQCVHSQTCNNSSVQINIAQLPAGVYFMKVMDETGVTTVVRVVKSGQ